MAQMSRLKPKANLFGKLFCSISPLPEAFLPGFWYPGAPVHLNREKFKDFSSFSHIKGKLPEHDINGIFHYLWKPGSIPTVIQVADTKVLLYNVPEF